MSGDTGLFALAERKLDWIDSRQKQLAQNISNTDTPAYKPRDVTPFGSVLNQFQITPTRTSPLHLASATSSSGLAPTIPMDHGPDGNAVALEDQLTQVANDETSQALVGNLWKSYMGMFMTALGHS